MQSLPKPVAAIAWGYIGADLSDFFCAYLSFVRNKKKFLSEDIRLFDWQKLAEQCVFYEQGYDWITVNIASKCSIDHVEVVCCALRAKKLDFVKKRRRIYMSNSEPGPEKKYFFPPSEKKKYLDGFLNINTGGVVIELEEDLRYTVAAADSGDYAVGEWAIDELWEGLSGQSKSIMGMYLAKTGFGRMVPTWHEGDYDSDDDDRTPPYALLYETSNYEGDEAKYSPIQLALMSGSADALKTLNEHGFYWPEGSIIPYMLHLRPPVLSDIVDALWYTEKPHLNDFMTNGNELIFQELLHVMWRKKEEEFIDNVLQMPSCFPGSEERFERWRETRISNDDIFWAEISL